MTRPKPLDELYNHDGMALAELVNKGEITAGELLDVVINRIETLNPKLNAIEQTNIELAREKAGKDYLKVLLLVFRLLLRRILIFPAFRRPTPLRDLPMPRPSLGPAHWRNAILSRG